MARAIQPAADERIFQAARSFKPTPTTAVARAGNATPTPTKGPAFRTFEYGDRSPASLVRQAAERLTDYYNELPLRANIREWAREQAEQVYRDWAIVRRAAIRQEHGDDDLSSSSSESSSSGDSSDGDVEETPLVARARRIANIGGPRTQDTTPFVEDDDICEDVDESIDNGSIDAEGVAVSDGGDD
jgi:hypothetical protein